METCLGGCSCGSDMDVGIDGCSQVISIAAVQAIAVTATAKAATRKDSRLTFLCSPDSSTSGSFSFVISSDVHGPVVVVVMVDWKKNEALTALVCMLPPQKMSNDERRRVPCLLDSSHQRSVFEECEDVFGGIGGQLSFLIIKLYPIT